MEQPTSSLTLRRENNSLPVPAGSDLHLSLPPSAWAEQQEDDLAIKEIVSMIRRRWPVIAGVAVVFFAAVAAYTLSRPTVYGGQFRMLIEPINNDNQSLTSTVQQLPIAPSLLDYETQIQVLLNQNLIEGSVERLQETYPNLTARTVVENLAISRMENTRILEVRYNSTSQSEVLAVLDQLAQDYLDYSLKERQTNLRQGIQFIENQLPQIRERVDELQQELQLFRQLNNFVDPDLQAGRILGQATQLEQGRLLVDQSLAQARANYAALQGEEGQLAALSTGSVYEQLIGELRQTESQIATEQTRFQDTSLAIRVLRDRRERLLPILQEEARRVVGGRLAEAATQITVLQAQREAIVAAQATLGQQERELPVLIRRYTDLQRELTVATDSLSRFLSAREALQIDASQREIPWQLVQDPLLYGAPIEPKLFRNIVLGIVGGTVLGLAMGFIVEKLDDVYHNAEELRVKTGLPLLGLIPRQRELAELEAVLVQERTPLMNLDQVLPEKSDKYLLGEWGAVPRQSQRSSQFFAAFQVLCTKIQLLRPDHPVRSLVVSSALEGDGKTTVALHLAQAAAEMGLRVLLVDGDLRQGALQARLNLNAAKGLSHLITQQASLAEVIYQPQVQPGFYVLPVGVLPPNAVSILSSEAMKQVMAEVTKRFDLVIYDVPPMEGLADASLIAPQTDGFLLVVRLGRTERFAILQTLDNIKLAQLPILGLAVNGVR